MANRLLTFSRALQAYCCCKAAFVVPHDNISPIAVYLAHRKCTNVSCVQFAFTKAAGDSTLQCVRSWNLMLWIVHAMQLQLQYRSKTFLLFAPLTLVCLDCGRQPCCHDVTIHNPLQTTRRLCWAQSPSCYRHSAVRANGMCLRPATGPPSSTATIRSCSTATSMRMRQVRYSICVLEVHGHEGPS